MTAAQWVGLLVGISTLMGSVGMGVKFLVKHYFSELKPNGGGSMNDRLFRIETRVDELYRHLIERD